ncbi:DUF4175 domain-containing protein [Luteimonas fraxinea]|uniref:DUF4175 domain-containing protein n=1 Tax=Luteimonas fraxinea TaxID=2901869 RepID=A0ABS8UG80_9GAMM|nr:DUF4175 domain-containing protein [Luteimonas fraxinea]MCD9098490.1 DUF4175 domain-containing protein [Luteimonas fraxinea]MCD9127223.1 DUF4175 domain-containing protein [Luteimonas fraxinea]
MSVVAQLTRTLGAARRRAVASVLLCALPLIAGGAALTWRLAGMPFATGVALAGLAVVAWLASRRMVRFDRAWLTRRLDADRADMDDSAALVFARAETLGALQRLQQSRLQARLTSAPWTSVPVPLPTQTIAAAWVSGAILIAAAVWWPPIAPNADAQTRLASRSAAVNGTPVLQSQALRIDAPAYTGQAMRTQTELDAQAPVSATLRWTLRFAPQPQRVALRLHDDSEIAFVREGEDWVATLRLDQSWLYRIAVDGNTDHILARAQPWRLDAVPDRPPEVRVRTPEETLSTYTRGQRAWPLVFEASDDHGVAPDAQLRITVTRGSGEAITFEDRTMPLRGRGDARALTFATTLDPVALGLEEGGDLVAQLEVRDNRAPEPQRARSASLILRWPPPAPVDADGLEGLARDVLPAYFRSQRQIIIDAEALIAEQPRIERSAFEGRSDALGVDQRILRLRYGQFLGEESEGGPRPPPTDDAEAPPPRPRKPLPIDDFGQTDTPPVDAHDDDDHAHDDAPAAQGAATHDDHNHDHDHAPQDAMTFGRADDVLATFGHTHDLPEAATLLDPKTREILRGALQAMWQSELHLRQAAPREALPHANRALELIKQVQEADRIYLARVGASLPPVDPTRRLEGDRDGIAPRAVPAPDVDTDAAPANAWRALAWNDAPDLDGLISWAQAHPRQVDDPLALLAAVDALRRDAACADCRQAARGQLWRVLQRPLPAPARRAAPDAMGARYLEALQADAP